MDEVGVCVHMRLGGETIEQNGSTGGWIGQSKAVNLWPKTFNIKTDNLLIWQLMYSRENACSDLFDKSRSGLDFMLHFLTIISQ